MMDKKKILMIDDTDTFLFILNHILGIDYDTFISKSGEDGLAVAREETPDLILLDVMMPGMTGFDVLRELKADAALKDIPVILITGNSSEEEENAGYALGAVAYIKKPFVKSIVLEIVQGTLQ
jgi:CheY-like chemotaxis protein